jgi:hypothetical protein
MLCRWKTYYHHVTLLVHVVHQQRQPLLLLTKIQPVCKHRRSRSIPSLKKCCTLQSESDLIYSQSYHF